MASLASSLTSQVSHDRPRTRRSEPPSSAGWRALGPAQPNERAVTVRPTEGRGIVTFSRYPPGRWPALAADRHRRARPFPAGRGAAQRLRRSAPMPTVSGASAICGTPLGIATAHAGVLLGLDSHPVQIEVCCTRGPAFFQMVGLAEATVREARVRVASALAVLGVLLDEYAVTVNLAPADLRKTGATLDVAIALSMLAAVGDCRPRPRRNSRTRRALARRANPTRSRCAGAASGRDRVAGCAARSFPMATRRRRA